MSFTSTVKEEVSRLETTRLEDISELSAIMRIAATITPNISITIESNAVARRTFKLIKNIYYPKLLKTELYGNRKKRKI